MDGVTLVLTVHVDTLQISQYLILAGKKLPKGQLYHHSFWSPHVVTYSRSELLSMRRLSPATSPFHLVSVLKDFSLLRTLVLTVHIDTLQNSQYLILAGKKLPKDQLYHHSFWSPHVVTYSRSELLSMRRLSPATSPFHLVSVLKDFSLLRTLVLTVHIDTLQNSQYLILAGKKLPKDQLYHHSFWSPHVVTYSRSELLSMRRLSPATSPFHLVSVLKDFSLLRTLVLTVHIDTLQNSQYLILAGKKLPKDQLYHHSFWSPHVVTYSRSELLSMRRLSPATSPFSLLRTRGCGARQRAKSRTRQRIIIITTVVSNRNDRFSKFFASLTISRRCRSLKFLTPRLLLMRSIFVCSIPAQ